MTYCSDSGEIATAACPNTEKGWYKESNIPGTCVEHLGSVTSEQGYVGVRDDDDDEDDDDD